MMQKIIWTVVLTYLFGFSYGQKKYWKGPVKIQGHELQIILKIVKEGENYTCGLSIPEQNLADFQADSIHVGPDSAYVSFEVLRAEYKGQFIQDSVIGVWVQSGREIPVNLIISDSGLSRPQEPIPPFPYDVEDVEYFNRSAGIHLFGTFTKPKGVGPFPTVLLISGSGPQNRESELLGHKPFYVWADYLTRRGIAVLRYDERGVGESTGVYRSATSRDLADDVMSGLHYLTKRTDVDIQKIGLMGHSEGGLVAPMVGVETDSVSFIVLLAGPAVPCKQLMVRQTRMVLEASGSDEADIDKIAFLNSSLYDVAISPLAGDSLYARLQSVIRSYYDALNDQEKEEAGPYQQFYLKLAAQLTDPWFRYFVAYEPADNLERLTCPVLAVNGSNDLQVESSSNLKAAAYHLEKGKCRDFKIKEFSGLNHLFQLSETGNPSEYVKIEQTISPEVLEYVGNWIVDQTK